MPQEAANVMTPYEIIATVIAIETNYTFTCF